MTEQNHQSQIPEEDRDIIKQNMASMHNGDVNVVFREYPGGIRIEGINLSDRFQPLGTIVPKRRRRQISETDVVIESLSAGNRAPVYIGEVDGQIELASFEHELRDDEDGTVTTNIIVNGDIPRF